MLKELEAAIDKERRDYPEGPEADEVGIALMRAARDLLSKQVIHQDDHNQKTNWQLICRHRGYFDALMGSFGYELVVDGAAEFVMVLPREAVMAGRRGNVSKIETLVLFALRILWEEASRQGEQDDRGWVDVDTTILVDHLASLGATMPLKKGEVRTLLTDLRRRGVVRVGGEDLEEEAFPIRIAPVISRIVGPDLARTLLAYLERIDPEGDEGGDTVLEFIENGRAEGEPDTSSAPPALGDPGGGQGNLFTEAGKAPETISQEKDDRDV